MSYNVDRSNIDPFYRYKMPKLLAKVEGKGNGIKTVIVNMVDVAKALSRPATYPCKFFGCELGAQTQFDLKNDRYIVNGSHDAEKLQNLLDVFIKKFVLCPECSNPETKLAVQAKKQTISQRCIACGYSGQIDMRHKLTTFILKNPSDQVSKFNSSTTTPKKQTKKGGKKKGDKDDDRASPEANAQQQMAAQRASGGVIDAPPEFQEEDDDGDWGEDITEEAIKQRMEELTDAAKGLALTDDLEKTPEERIDIFYKFLQLKRDDKKVNQVQEITAEAERLEVKDKATLVLVELLFDTNILQQIKNHRKLLLSFCYENPKAQKYLLGGIEQLVGEVHKDILLPKVPHILKLLYDTDIVEEKVMLEWGEKVSKKYVSKPVAQEIHDKAEPFIKWLREAEEESEDESEDENIEVRF
ncbi:hypothetical protein LOTGIDRAFT_132224 [Lottia gigantea]|uniref:Eukaryotic translation initiation factor 5 n=1 Tax=Lottia gigantea TaxID=225164 RepID=V3Z1Q2_LOTGI|nr:hypothetical protein LOTGIDRAFT_132224 [Lottia gigantea]ESO84468.1 hypothetical protein LOTGIDRAFT_132224 [Lottia gigantea]